MAKPGPKKGSKRKRKMRGKGWLSDAVGWVANKVVKPVHNIVKQSKIGSTLAGRYNPLLGAVVSQAGYGKCGCKGMKGGRIHAIRV